MFWNIARWFDPSWWRYLFNDLPTSWWFGEEGRLERIMCRVRGHPKGEVFYTMYGDEPDHHCQTCGEDLG